MERDASKRKLNLNSYKEQNCTEKIVHTLAKTNKQTKSTVHDRVHDDGPALTNREINVQESRKGAICVLRSILNLNPSVELCAHLKVCLKSFSSRRMIGLCLAILCKL